MSIYERYVRTRGAALEGLTQARARLEAAERRQAAEAAQQVAAGQLLLHDPEVRLAMGPEQEAEAYERLNELEASLGLKPTPYVDVPKQEFAKQIYAGQVKVAEQALPAVERETLLDGLADATVARFGQERVARYMVGLRNEQTLMQAQQAASGQGRTLHEAAAEPPMEARQWVRSLIEPYAPPAVEDDPNERRGQPRPVPAEVTLTAGTAGGQSVVPGGRAVARPADGRRAAAPPTTQTPTRPTAPPARPAAPGTRPAGRPATRPAGRPAARPAGRQRHTPSLTDRLYPDVERWRALVERYFPSDQVENALHVMQGESSGDPASHNYNATTHDDSWGLFQINRWGANARTAPPPEQLVDPEFNVRYAAQMWRERGWQPWGAARPLGLVPQAQPRARQRGRR